MNDYTEDGSTDDSVCPVCNGTGNEKYELEDYLIHYPESVSASNYEHKTCAACGGSGKKS